MSRSRNGHTKSEWAAMKPIIKKLYLDDNKILDDVAIYLKDEHGFEATARQYKTRLKDWGLDDKKIKGPSWKAMSVVMGDRRNAAVNISFQVPSHCDKVRIITSELITKQMRRNRRPSMSLSEAHTVLQAKQIHILTEPLQTGISRPGPSTMQLPSPNSSTALSPASLFSSGSMSPTMQSSPSALSLNHAETFDNLPSLQSLFGNTYLAPGTDGNGQTEQPMGSAQVSSSARVPDDFDLISAFNQLSIDPTCDPDTRCALQQCIGRPYGHTTELLDDEKKLAVKWAAYYVFKFLPDCQARFDPAGRQRAEAISAFRTMLAHHSRYIFPYCNFMLTVLASNEEKDLVKDFLTDCCMVIDQDAVLRPSSYASPFHFALALYTQDQQGIDSYSREFERSSVQIGAIWGRESPNYLVNQYHSAWYKISLRRYHEASKIIREVLPISERVMGKQHITTVNCLAILARAHDELGNNLLAINHLEDAIGRLGEPVEVLQAYQHRLLRRLAMLQIKAGDYASAERHLHRTVSFRLARFGILAPSTWTVIHPYRDLLKEQGRYAEAREFFAAMEQRYHSRAQAEHIPPASHNPVVWY